MCAGGRSWRGWQSGHAAACKAVYAGSIPTPASNSHVELFVDILSGFLEEGVRYAFRDGYARRVGCDSAEQSVQILMVAHEHSRSYNRIL